MLTVLLNPCTPCEAAGQMLYIHRSAASDSSTSTHRPPLVTFIKSHVNDTRLPRSHPKRLNTQPTGLSLLLLCLCVQEAFRSVSQPPAQLSSCRAVCLWYFLEIHWGANAIRQYEVNIYEVRQWRSQRLDAIMRALNYKKKTDHGPRPSDLCCRRISSALSCCPHASL